jgi:AcrR family transcriptional regulator
MPESTRPQIGRPRAADDGEIFAAIGRLVTELGPDGVTLARVASRVGITASALAQRFGSKRALLLAYAARSDATVDAAFAGGRVRHPDPLDALPHALAGLAAGITTRVALANNLAFLQLDLVDDGLRPFAVAQSRRVRREIRALVVEAIEADALVHDDPDTLVALLHSVYSGAMLTWAVDGRGSLRNWIVGQVRVALHPFVVAGR